MADKKSEFQAWVAAPKRGFCPVFWVVGKTTGKTKSEAAGRTLRPSSGGAEQWSDMMRGDWGKNNEWPLKGTCEPSRGGGCQPGFACCSSGHKGSKINEISSSLEIRELTILSLLNVEWTHYCWEKREGASSLSLTIEGGRRRQQKAENHSQIRDLHSAGNKALMVLHNGLFACRITAF